jgi:hypothetical protein
MFKIPSLSRQALLHGVNRVPSFHTLIIREGIKIVDNSTVSDAKKDADVSCKNLVTPWNRIL